MMHSVTLVKLYCLIVTSDTMVAPERHFLVQYDVTIVQYDVTIVTP